MTPKRFRLAALGLAMLVVGACSSESSSSTTAGDASTTTEAMATSTSSTPTTSTTTPPATTTTTLASTTTSLPPFPNPKSQLEHGGESWAVYLAVADDFADPALDEAAATAQSYGFFAGATDINCDQGAAEAVGVAPGGSETVLAIQARGHPVVGTGLVQTFCLD
jgi:cell division septation protein DedD